MKIQKTTDLAFTYLKILSYGGFGKGKTHFACSMAKRFKTLGISAEAGLLTARNIKDENGNPLPIDFVEIESYEDLETIYHRLKNKVKIGDEDYGQYQAAFMDSITEIQDKCKQAIMAKNKNEAMQMQDWGALAQKIERMVRAFRDLPIHFITTALEEDETDKVTGEVQVWPMMQGSVQKRLPAYFDLVFYHSSTEVEKDGKREMARWILTANTGKYQGKDRSGRLPRVLKDADFSAVFDLIFK